jgi:hypothetical protein
LASSKRFAAGAGIGILHDYAAHRDERLQVVLLGTVFEPSYWIVTHFDMRELSPARATSESVASEIGAQKSIFEQRVAFNSHAHLVEDQARCSRRKFPVSREFAWRGVLQMCSHYLVDPVTYMRLH